MKPYSRLQRLYFLSGRFTYVETYKATAHRFPYTSICLCWDGLDLSSGHVFSAHWSMMYCILVQLRPMLPWWPLEKYRENQPLELLMKQRALQNSLVQWQTQEDFKILIFSFLGQNPDSWHQCTLGPAGFCSCVCMCWRPWGMHWSASAGCTSSTLQCKCET